VTPPTTPPVPTRAAMEAVVRRYYDACNAADVDAMAGCFTPDAVHYFPAGAPQGTFAGAAAIAAGWAGFVAAAGSQWTIDHLTVDEQRAEVVVEWTHWKTRFGTHLRGAEFCRFAPDGRIAEIRAYYACPAPGQDASYELGDFDYAGRGYPTEPPTEPGVTGHVRRSGV